MAASSVGATAIRPWSRRAAARIPRRLASTSGDIDRPFDRVGERGIGRDEDGRRIGPVLGLGDEIRGDACWIGRWGGQDHPFGRAGRQVDPDLADHLHLGGGDPGVARADDAIHRLDAGLGQAVGKCADGLGAPATMNASTSSSPATPSRTGLVVPSRSAGEATMTVSTPATRAGTTVMTSDEGYGADPPGT